MKKVIELSAGDTTSADVRGSGTATVYELEPVKWIKEINDGAKKRHFFAQSVYQTTLPPNTHNTIIPFRTAYMSGFSDTTSEGGAVVYTDLDNLDGIQLTPTIHAYGIAISNHAIRTTLVDLIRAAKEECTYYAGDIVDQAVVAGMAAAAAAGSTTRGASIVYGGTANYEEEGLAAGDIFQPSMVAKAKRKLMSSNQTYTDFSSAWASSSEGKNPWTSDPSDPFTLWVAPEQEEALLVDSQFINAAEYGGREAILTGEIGKYLGVKVVVTNNTPAYATGAGCTDGGGNTWAADGHRCIMAKPKAASALAWGKEPQLHIVPFPSELETRIILEMAYATDSIHDDAICWLSVVDD